MAKTPAQSARAILHIIVSGGMKANEIIMHDEVERAFPETDSTFGGHVGARIGSH
jgi:hypothetical protein